MKPRLAAFLMIAISVFATVARAEAQLDRELRQRLRTHKIKSLDPGRTPSHAKVVLGQLLFFDKALSGNRDIACATCHHPSLMNGDELSLSVGTGGVGLVPRPRPFVPRNATEIFDRGSPDWTTMFWDFRVSKKGGRFQTPAGDQLPAGLDNILAVQAMLPVTGHDEMRGMPGDPHNEIAILADDDFYGIWDRVMTRILSYPEYQALFTRAYPGTSTRKLGFQHAANAIAAFEVAAFTAPGSPWDRYVEGDTTAIGQSAKRGALLFYGRAGCVRCHSGNLLTDQRGHNIAVPQLGPGKAPEAPFDFGCARVTKIESDRFAFRTPPLRNVAATGPWMHNGAYTSLEAAVRHHLNPVQSLTHYDWSQLDFELQGTVQNDIWTVRSILATLDPEVRRPLHISREELNYILVFLRSLTSPALMSLDSVIPGVVPSGLPVDRLPAHVPVPFPLDG